MNESKELYRSIERWLEKYPNDRLFAPIVQYCPVIIKPVIPAINPYTELQQFTIYILNKYKSLPLNKQFKESLSTAEITTLYKEIETVLNVKTAEIYEKYRTLAALQPKVDSDYSLAPYLNNYDMTTDYHTNTANTKSGTVSQARVWSENTTRNESLNYSKNTQVASDENPNVWHNAVKEDYAQGATRTANQNTNGSDSRNEVTYDTVVRGTSNNSNIHKYGYWTNQSMPDTFEKIKVLASYELFDMYVKECIEEITLPVYF